jgi:hypothetical protein
VCVCRQEAGYRYDKAILLISAMFLRDHFSYVSPGIRFTERPLNIDEYQRLRPASRVDIIINYTRCNRHEPRREDQKIWCTHHGCLLDSGLQAKERCIVRSDTIGFDKGVVLSASGSSSPASFPQDDTCIKKKQPCRKSKEYCKGRVYAGRKGKETV